MPFKKTIRLRENKDNIQPIIHTALVFIFSVFSVGCPFPLLACSSSTDLKGERFSHEIRSQRSVRKISSETAYRHDLSTFNFQQTAVLTFADELSDMFDRQNGKIHSVGWKEVPTKFWQFRKICYLGRKMSCISMQITQVCRNQNGCQLITPFIENLHKLLIFSELCNPPKY